MNPSNEQFPWGPLLKEGAEARVSQQNPDFQAVYNRQKHKKFWGGLGLVAAGFIMLLGGGRAWQQYKEDQEFQETVKSYVQEVIPLEAPSWNTSSTEWKFSQTLLSSDDSDDL